MDDSSNAGAAAYRDFFLNSLLAFTLAFIASTLVHEGAHALTARALGVPAVLHHNFVSTQDESETSAVARLWIPASGPLVSLVLGLACLIWVRKRPTVNLASLTVLWLGLQSSIVFLGYLMLGPVVAYGDTGKVWAELGMPGGARWAIALASLAAMILIVRSTVPDFERHAPSDAPGADLSRRRVANALIAFPILAGAVVTTVLSLPAPTFISLLHPMTSPFAGFMAYGPFRRSPAPLPAGSLRADRISIPLVIVTLAFVAISRTLVLGLPLG